MQGAGSTPVPVRPRDICFCCDITHIPVPTISYTPGQPSLTWCLLSHLAQGFLSSVGFFLGLNCWKPQVPMGWSGTSAQDRGWGGVSGARSGAPQTGRDGSAIRSIS